MVMWALTLSKKEIASTAGHETGVVTVGRAGSAVVD